MSENVVREIELSMEDIKAKIAKGALLERLCENEDFKAYILDDFMGKNRLQDLLTKTVSPSFQNATSKLYVDSQLTAVGALRMFMLYTEQEAAQAKQALLTAEEERERALEEVVI